MKNVPAGYSPIAPIKVLQDLHKEGNLGSYLVLLAHDVGDNLDEYQALVKAIRFETHNVNDPGPFIILDNSTVELGAPILANSMLMLAARIGADAWVLPDVMEDKWLTLKAIDDAMDIIERTMIPFMRIPQGGSLEEIMECIEEIDKRCTLRGDHKEFGELWGVPRWIANKFGSRKPIIQYLNALGKPNVSIHLMGMSRNFQDDIDCTSLPNVIGIDSANPVVIGQESILMNHLDGFVPHKDRGNLWEHEVATVATNYNCVYVRELIKRTHFTYVQG